MAVKRKTEKQFTLNPEFEHMQPQVVEMEKMILAALMIDQDAFSAVSDKLQPEMFYEPRNQKIYKAIVDLSINEKPTDFQAVVEELKHQGTFEEVGGIDYLFEIDESASTSANLLYRVAVLNQKYIARQLITYTSKIQTMAFDATNDIDEVVQSAEADLFALTQKQNKKDYEKIDSVTAQALEQLKIAAQNKTGMTGVPTGYKELDNMTAGWQKSDLVILAGRPAMGKTAFALCLAKNIAVDNNIPVGFFSLEMSNVQLVNRMISMHCGIEGKKIQNGQLDKNEWERLDDKIDKLSKAPLFVDDTPGMSIFELRTKARRMVKNEGVQIILIDYLQLMNANGAKFGSRQEEVSTISRSLKGLAKELNIPIIALSQLNRGVENRGEANDAESKKPQMSDLRESGAIEQDADMILFVHRPEYYRIYEDAKGNDMRGKAQIIIAKHRKGGTGDINLNFVGSLTLFKDPDPNDNSNGGEIIGSRMNSDESFPPMPTNTFDPLGDMNNMSINDMF